MSGMDMSTGGGGEHGAALAGLLWLPVAVVGGLFLLQLAAARSAHAARAVAAIAGAGPAARGAALLMLVSATVHIAIAPDHAGEPATAALFVLDSLALVVLAAGTVLVPAVRAVRVAAAIVLAAGIAAYGFYLVAGLETADAVGVATKLVEAAAIALCLAPAVHIKFLEVSRS